MSYYPSKAFPDDVLSNRKAVNQRRISLILRIQILERECESGEIAVI